MKKCERCKEVDIPKKLHYCDECREIKRKESHNSKLEKQRNGYYSRSNGGFKQEFNIGKVELPAKLAKSGTIRLSIAVIKRAIADKQWWWLESENSDLFFDLAEIDKGKFIKKIKNVL